MSTVTATAPSVTTATPAPALDEKALRRPEFSGGVPIRLFDGQEWHFPTPIVEAFVPRRGPDGKTRQALSFDWGPGYDDLVEAFVSAEYVRDEAVALYDLGFDLLRRNYAVTFDDMRHVLKRFKETDPRHAEMLATWEAIASVALGKPVEKKVDDAGGTTG